MDKQPSLTKSNHPADDSPPHGGKRFGQYRSVSRLAIGSIALGLLSILTVFHPLLFVVPLAGVVVAWIALVQISELPDQLTGRRVAWVGMGLSLGLWGLGGGALAMSLMIEVPHGYEAIEFDDLRSPDEKKQQVPKFAIKLGEDKKKIFIKGYIYPGSQNYGIKRFLLVPTIEHCNFCRKDLQPTEVIFVTLAGDLTTEYRVDRVSLGGKLAVDPEQLKEYGVPYRLKADYIK